jgi:hypothetical protein
MPLAQGIDMRLLNESCGRTIAAATLGLLASACAETVGPSSGTRVEAIVQDTVTSPAVTGTMAGNVYASLWNGDRWHDLGSANGITIPLQVSGRTTTVHGEASVASASYDRVRLVLQGVTARVSRGSVVEGTTLTSDVNLVLGGSDQRAELSLPVSSFSVEPDSSVKRVVVFELRSHRWLTTRALQSGRVEDADLQTAVLASTRVEMR